MAGSEENYDAQYKPIVPFRDWALNVSVRAQLVDPEFENFKRALERTDASEQSGLLHDVVVAAALETGSIEGLYRRSTGVTLSLINGAITATRALEEATDNRQREVDLVQGQRESYELALDVVTEKQPLTEALIRQVHAMACSGQDTYILHAENGPVHVPLEKGAYKTKPNHVITPDGTLHAYCPPAEVAMQMEVLIREVRGGGFQSAHPVVQASYLHHSLTHIHPFSDGNGRTARVIASIPLIQAYHLPLLVMADRDTEYRDAQAAADHRSNQPFVSLIEEMVVDLLSLLTLRLSAGTDSGASKVDVISSKIDARIAASESLEKVAERLESVLEDLVGDRLAQIDLPKQVEKRVGWGSGGGGGPGAYMPRSRLLFATAEVPNVQPPLRVSVTFKVSISPDQDEPRPVSITVSGSDSLLLRVNEVLPRPSQSFRLRLQAWVDQRLAGIPETMLKRLS